MLALSPSHKVATQLATHRQRRRKGCLPLGTCQILSCCYILKRPIFESLVVMTVNTIACEMKICLPNSMQLPIGETSCALAAAPATPS